MAMKISYLFWKLKSKAIHLLELDRRLRGWSDERYLKLIYWIRMGERLNLRNPRSFNEKLQWLKLRDRDPKYTRLVDKHLVKSEVAAILGDQTIVPTLGVWSNASEIDFSKLPNEFVLKVNHNSGGVIVCRDKASLDIDSTVAWLNERLQRSYFWPGREWPYRDVQALVFAEKYLASGLAAGSRGDEREVPSTIVDYKFFCFHGEPRFLNVQQDMSDHHDARFAFLNMDWTFADFGRVEYPRYIDLPPRPKKFEEMLDFARRLASDIPFVRVDFFEHEDRVLFSEMTFFPTSGMIPFTPRRAGRRIGDWLDLTRVRPGVGL